MLVRPASGKKVLWQEMLRHELLAALERRPVIIVPVGSVEQHGPHCPQDVDISIPYHLAIAAADESVEFPVIVAPPMSWSRLARTVTRAVTSSPGKTGATNCSVCPR